MRVCRRWAQVSIPVLWRCPPEGVLLSLSGDTVVNHAEHITTLSLETSCMEQVLMLPMPRLKSVRLPLSVVLERQRRFHSFVMCHSGSNSRPHLEDRMSTRSLTALSVHTDAMTRHQLSADIMRLLPQVMGLCELTSDALITTEAIRATVNNHPPPNPIFCQLRTLSLHIHAAGALLLLPRLSTTSLTTVRLNIVLNANGDNANGGEVALLRLVALFEALHSLLLKLDIATNNDL